jgi:hypothetical protein
MTKQTQWMLGLVVVLAAACGGGNDSTPVAATDAVPDSASQSALGMTTWLKALSNDPTEVKEPLDVTTFAPAASESTEPEALQ